MTTRHFCTYFDHRYLARGLALYQSLTTHCPDFVLWVLALSAEAAEALQRAGLANLRVVALQELEQFDPDLLSTRTGRSLVEYYFTCSPCLPRYLFAMQRDIDMLTYLDSDLYFFDSPESIFAELQGYSVGIVPHRFAAAAQRSHGQFGTYNVGWLTFVRDDNGMACLEWWRTRCIEWCFDRLDGERYADQKYLEQFDGLFDGVHAIAHPGANLAPWNVASHRIEMDDEAVSVDGRELVFFHFQGLREVTRHWYDSNLGGYGAHLTSILRQHVFRPYIAALKAAEKFSATICSSTSAPHIRRRATGAPGLRYRVGRLARTARAALLGNLVRV